MCDEQRQLYIRCKWCLGSRLREVKPIAGLQENGLHQCLTCFCVMQPLRMQVDQQECPVCLEPIYGDDIGGLHDLPIATKTEYACHRTSVVIHVCVDCNICICCSCAEKMAGNPCVVCRRTHVTSGSITNVSPLDSMGEDLKFLLADFALTAIRKWPKYANFAWEYILEYAKWLFVIKKVADDPNAVYSPCKKIDALWHLHILCTKNYRACCEIICGQYINHRLVSDSDPTNARLEAAVRAIRDIEPFTEDTAHIWNIVAQSPTYYLQPTIRVTVRSLTGRSTHTPCRPDNTVADVLIRAGEIKGQKCAATVTAIVYGKQVLLNKTLAQCGLQDGAVIHTILNLAGC